NNKIKGNTKITKDINIRYGEIVLSFT
ncbi:MAG: hypothetical protein RL582_597, partial [Bacteroidota bacterium]